MAEYSKKYSVLMSVYGKEKPEYLKCSINSMLNQTIAPDDFVLVEDGPLTEELYKVIATFAMENPGLFNIVTLTENQGLGPALRLGVTKCKNELIARMDSDDYSKANRIEEQLKIFGRFPDYSLVGSNVYEFEYDVNTPILYSIVPETHEEILKFSKKRCPFKHPSLLYKKSAIMNAGNYANCRLFEDYDLYIRLLKNNCKCYNIQVPLVCLRIGNDFYKRRGGLTYLIFMLKFKNKQLQDGYFNLFDYLVSTIPHIIVCLSPNFIRNYIYKKLLRKKVEEIN